MNGIPAFLHWPAAKPSCPLAGVNHSSHRQLYVGSAVGPCGATVTPREAGRPHSHGAKYNVQLLEAPEHIHLAQVVDAYLAQDAQGRASHAAASTAMPAAGNGVTSSSGEDAAISPHGQLLDSIYEAIEEVQPTRRGYKIPMAEADAINATGGSSSYGELLPQGADRLAELLDLQPGDVFLDAGCGTGQALLHVALAAPHAAACIGVELSATRLYTAALALDALDELQQRHACVELRQQDLSTDASLGEATHVYFNTTAHSARLCRTVAARLATSAAFRMLVTSRALPVQPYLRRLGEVRLPYNYLPSGRGYVYVKAHAPAPPALAARFQCAHGVCWAPGALGVPQLPVEAPEVIEPAALRGVVLGAPGGGSGGGEGTS